MTQEFTKSFKRFVNAYVAASNDNNRGLVTEYFEEWGSPCLSVEKNELIPNEGDEVKWRPVKRGEVISLQNVTDALDLPKLPEMDVLFGSQYSHDLNAKTNRGNLTILQVWNDQDLERLQKNLIAHVLMKRRLKQDDTLFFAVTDEEDYVVSIKPDTGQVVLEFIGKSDLEVLAESLPEFFDTLTPNPQQVYL